MDDTKDLRADWDVVLAKVARQKNWKWMRSKHPRSYLDARYVRLDFSPIWADESKTIADADSDLGIERKTRPKHTTASGDLKPIFDDEK